MQLFFPSLAALATLLQQLFAAPYDNYNQLFSHNMVALNARTCLPTAAAVAYITGQEVSGTVKFFGSDCGQVRVVGEIKGLTPGYHGFHIHQFGDISSGWDCMSTGGHFNPYNTVHGAREDKVRHVGDLGNIIANAEGVAKFEFVDKVIRLHGVRNILSRGVVVHEGKDDEGKGGNADSKKTGNAGKRAGCGVIGNANLTSLWASVEGLD